MRVKVAKWAAAKTCRERSISPPAWSRCVPRHCRGVGIRVLGRAGSRSGRAIDAGRTPRRHFS